MRILVIGGTGPIGAYTALHLQSSGHDVTISSRNAPKKKGPLSELPWLESNYLEESFTASDLKAWDTIIFAAGSDIRHIPEGADADEHFLHANGVMVPRFAKLAKDAGVKTFIHIGSFYSHVLPGIVDTNAYVRSRSLAANGVADLASPAFRSMSIDAPFVVGVPAGMKSDMFMAYFAYAKGWHPNVAPFGPAGGTNFISVRSLAQAVENAIHKGVGGRVYLVGDENLSFTEFFAHFFAAVGNEVHVPSLDQEHPFLPDVAIVQGRGNFINYEPDDEVIKTLDYDRNDIGPTIHRMAKDVDAIIGEVTPLDIGPDAVFDSALFALACKYAHAVDAGDGNLLRAICTDDIILRGPTFLTQGLDDVAEIPSLLRTYFAKTRHVVHQQLVSIQGDDAKGQTFCSAEHLLHPEPGNPQRQILKWAIRYQDYFKRADGTWRFTRRELIVDWTELTPAQLPI